MRSLVTILAFVLVGQAAVAMSCPIRLLGQLSSIELALERLEVMREMSQIQGLIDRQTGASLLEIMPQLENWRDLLQNDVQITQENVNEIDRLILRADGVRLVSDPPRNGRVPAPENYNRVDFYQHRFGI